MAAALVGVGLWLAMPEADAQEGMTASGAQLGPRGYQKFPSGIIIQWGREESVDRVTFPIPFPTQVFVITTSLRSEKLRNRSINSYERTRTGFRVRSSTPLGGEIGEPFDWIAIGD